MISMSEKHTVDMREGPRSDHYRYFGELDDPYFGIADARHVSQFFGVLDMV